MGRGGRRATELLQSRATETGGAMSLTDPPRFSWLYQQCISVRFSSNTHGPLAPKSRMAGFGIPIGPWPHRDSSARY